MHVLSIPMFRDNYAYVLYDEHTKEAAVIDPAEPEIAVAAVQNLAKPEHEGGKGLILKLILNTHHHHDHSGGNSEMMEAFPSTTLYAGHSSPSPTAINPTDRTGIRLSKSITIYPYFTPCHTLDSISYFVTDSSDRDLDPLSKSTVGSAVFTGDTLFHAGCGRFFEGSASQMHLSLNKILSSLPDSTPVYPGHEYTESNVKWALSVLPDDKHLLSLKSYVDDNPSSSTNGAFTIGDEKNHNLFMRVDDKVVQAALGSRDPIKVMDRLRVLKNRF